MALMASEKSSAAVSLTEERAIAPPRPFVFFVLGASGLALLAAGVVATAHLLFQMTVPWETIPRRHGLALAAALGLTLLTLALRSLRWVFLLRRTQTYVPLRDSIVIYLSGFSLLVLPLLAGETLARAAVARQRRVATGEAVILVNAWERALDLLALLAIAGVAALATGGAAGPAAGALALVVAAAVPGVRRLGLGALRGVARFVARFVFGEPPSMTDAAARRLIGPAAFSVGFGLSLVAWAMPGLALWGLVRSWDGSVSLAGAQALFGETALLGSAVLAPGGLLVAGASLLARLEALLDPSAATLVVFAFRVATTGLTVALGVAVMAHHLRARRPGPASGSAHFDAIAEVYDAQIPEARRLALLDRKTVLMQHALQASLASPPLAGLDVGCGQGHYVKRMRDLGFDVVGIDDSPHQVARARSLFDRPDVVQQGSVLAIPFGAGTFDFAYCINVLHHLDSAESQRAAFEELRRVLKPGGTLFVHEINTRNWLFRFYMGYLFPALNCIDEGVERWLLPHRLAEYAGQAPERIEYFTFLPEFVPAAVVRRLAPVERRLEASRLGRYSAHYMAVFRKPEAGGWAPEARGTARP